MIRGAAWRVGLAAGALTFLADQASKWWILEIARLPEIRRIDVLPVLSLTMVWNQGVTFGLMSGFGEYGFLALTLVSLGVVAALGVWLARAESAVVGAAIGAIAGGALGNALDRLRFGAVVDFLHAHVATPWGELSWYVFNVADAAIVCGVAVLVVDSWRPLGRG